MRLRYVAIAFVVFFSIVGVYTVCHQAGAVDTIIGMARRITIGALMGAGFWAASHLLQRWMNQPVRPVTPATPSTPVITFSPQPPAAPVPTFAVMPSDGQGKYRIRGRDKETHFEITEVVFADSPSNAQLKAELKGVQVLAVERAG